MRTAGTTTREIERVIDAVPASDGAGVSLRRSLGAVRGRSVDPFLLLDELFSEEAGDSLPGFPPHPHRGFETVSYMLEGYMRHEDHLGNRSEIGPGGVQWMTAGRGVIHSEMPLQERGRMHGFQLWINLPRREKMRPAQYRDVPADAIPLIGLERGGRVRVIAGSVTADGRTITGPVQGLSTDPTYLDVELPAGATFRHVLPHDYTAFLYVFAGGLDVGPEGRARPLAAHRAGVTAAGEELLLRGGTGGGRALLVAGRPLGEPVFQYGPFVMATREEVEQAIHDYRNGTLTNAAS